MSIRLKFVAFPLIPLVMSCALGGCVLRAEPPTADASPEDASQIDDAGTADATADGDGAAIDARRDSDAAARCSTEPPGLPCCEGTNWTSPPYACSCGVVTNSIAFCVRHVWNWGAEDPCLFGCREAGAD